MEQKLISSSKAKTRSRSARGRMVSKNSASPVKITRRTRSSPAPFGKRDSALRFLKGLPSDMPQSFHTRRKLVKPKKYFPSLPAPLPSRERVIEWRAVMQLTMKLGENQLDERPGRPQN